MAESIESFVTRLQQEGIEAGKQAADKLLAETRANAQELINKAQQEARGIIDIARKENQKNLDRFAVELNMAARDVVMRLRDGLNRVMQEILKQNAQPVLQDSNFVGRLLHEIVVSYARSDVEGKTRITVDVQPQLRDQLCKWALGEVARAGKDVTASVDLKGTLKEAGFTYSLDGAKVEVTLDSVVQTLAEMVSPALREIIDRAVKGRSSQA